jgi:type IV pilus assembly protein PilF
VRARLHTELAAGYFELGNIGVALEEVKEALRADPNYSPANNVAGLVYSQLKEDALAEQSFQRALSLSPGDYDANNNYGEFLC